MIRGLLFLAGGISIGSLIMFLITLNFSIFIFENAISLLLIALGMFLGDE